MVPINTQVSQADEAVANLPNSSNGCKPMKGSGSGKASTKTPANVIGQTSALSGEV